MWKVSHVMSVSSSDASKAEYGFNVTTKPLVLFAYETKEATEAAAKQVRTAIERAVLVKPFSV